MRILFFCPHSRVSGGVETTFNYANALVKAGVDVTVAILKNFERKISWYSDPILFNIIGCNKRFSKEYLDSYDICFTFCDGPSIAHTSTKRVLHLQGYSGSRVENVRLSESYNLIIATSKWLSEVAKKYNKNNNVVIIPPGINDIFTRAKLSFTLNIPIVGSLYHTSIDKRFEDFANIVKKYFMQHKKYVHCFILSAANVAEIPILDKYLIPYSIFVRPPKKLLPIIYSSCHAWIAPSVNEGFGLTPIEAMACGCPVIMARNKGLNGHIQHCVNVFTYKDTTNGMNLLYDIISNKQLTKLLRKNGYNTVNKLYNSVVLPEFIKKVSSL